MNKTTFFFSTYFLLFFSICVSAQQEQDIQLTNISQVNTGALEFSPVFYHHGLVYVSSQSRQGIKDHNIKENTFDLLYADLGPKGKLSKPAPLSLKVNTKYHEGPVCFSSNMNNMFFTRSNLYNDKIVKDEKGKVQLKIYQATKGVEDWENITELSFNDNQFSCMHPSITADGKRLYFASDRPGGYGGMDIYYSDWERDDWGDPVNLGPKINSNRSEAFPYIHASGKLFFASNRQLGMGGLDIFMVDVRKKKTGDVIHLPEPINSFQDDLGFTISNSGKTAFFSSNRGGGKGKDDLYRADIPNGLKGLFSPEEIALNIVVKNKDTKEAISGAMLRVVEIPEHTSAYSLPELFTPILSEDKEDMVIRYRLSNESIKGNAIYKTNANGQQTVAVLENKSYVIAAAKEDFISNFVQISTFDKTKNKIELFLSPEKTEIVLPPVATIEVGTIVILDQIFYDFNKSYIRTDASRGLDAILSLMTKYPAMRIDLTAHTDSRGDTKYNQKLSEQRAISAKYFLTSRGIAEDRIKAMGKGESMPRNGCKDGVRCSETEHQYNRRTEIKITSLGSAEKIEYKNNLPDYIDVPKRKKKN